MTTLIGPRTLTAIDEMPYNSTNPQAPFPEDYAPFTPMGQCPTHGLEAHTPSSREVSTGAGDICLAATFVCGEIDTETVF